MVGGSLVLSAISILVGIGAIVIAQDVQRRIDEERFNRNKPTPGPTTTVATTAAAAAAAASGEMTQIITSTIYLALIHSQLYLHFRILCW